MFGARYFRQFKVWHSMHIGSAYVAQASSCALYSYAMRMVGTQNKLIPIDGDKLVF